MAPKSNAACQRPKIALPSVSATLILDTIQRSLGGSVVGGAPNALKTNCRLDAVLIVYELLPGSYRSRAPPLMSSQVPVT